MSRKSRKNEAFDLPSFQMIRAASNGDIEAINAVLKHYEGYIAALSTRKMYDENRQVHYCVDETLRRRLETKLITTDVDGVDISLGTELDSYDMDDSDSVANTDLLSKLSLLMDMGKKKTKYNVLNLNSKFTVDQKQTLEHVFDALYAKYTNAKANDIIQTIIDSF